MRLRTSGIDYLASRICDGRHVPPALQFKLGFFEEGVLCPCTKLGRIAVPESLHDILKNGPAFLWPAQFPECHPLIGQGCSLRFEKVRCLALAESPESPPHRRPVLPLVGPARQVRPPLLTRALATISRVSAVSLFLESAYYLFVDGQRFPGSVQFP